MSNPKILSTETLVVMNHLDDLIKKRNNDRLTHKPRRYSDASDTDSIDLVDCENGTHFDDSGDVQHKKVEMDSIEENSRILSQKTNESKLTQFSKQKDVSPTSSLDITSESTKKLKTPNRENSSHKPSSIGRMRHNHSDDKKGKHSSTASHSKSPQELSIATNMTHKKDSPLLSTPQKSKVHIDKVNSNEKTKLLPKKLFHSPRKDSPNTCQNDTFTKVSTKSVSSPVLSTHEKRARSQAPSRKRSQDEIQEKSPHASHTRSLSCDTLQAKASNFASAKSKSESKVVKKTSLIEDSPDSQFGVHIDCMIHDSGRTKASLIAEVEKLKRDLSRYQALAHREQNLRKKQEQEHASALQKVNFERDELLDRLESETSDQVEKSKEQDSLIRRAGDAIQERAELQQTIAILQSDIDKLNEEGAKLREQLAEVRKEYRKTLESRNELVSQMEDMFDQRENEIEVQDTSITGLREAQSDLTAAVRDAKQKVVAIEQENASLSHKLQQATDFRTTLQGKLELEHASLIQVTKERDDKEIVIQSLNEKMEELKAELERSRKTSETIIQAKDKELQELQEFMENMQEMPMWKDLQDNLTESELERESLQSDLDECRKRIVGLEIHVSALQREIASRDMLIQERNEEHLNTIERLRAQQEVEVERIIEENRTSKVQTQERIDKLELERAKMEASLRAKNRQLDQSEAELSVCRKRLREVYSRLADADRVRISLLEQSVLHEDMIGSLELSSIASDASPKRTREKQSQVGCMQNEVINDEAQGTDLRKAVRQAAENKHAFSSPLEESSADGESWSTWKGGASIDPTERQKIIDQAQEEMRTYWQKLKRLWLQEHEQDKSTALQQLDREHQSKIQKLGMEHELAVEKLKLEHSGETLTLKQKAEAEKERLDMENKLSLERLAMQHERHVTVLQEKLDSAEEKLKVIVNECKQKEAEANNNVEALQKELHALQASLHTNEDSLNQAIVTHGFTKDQEIHYEKLLACKALAAILLHWRKKRLLEGLRALIFHKSSHSESRQNVDQLRKSLGVHRLVYVLTEIQLKNSYGFDLCSTPISANSILVPHPVTRAFFLWQRHAVSKRSTLFRRAAVSHIRHLIGMERLRNVIEGKIAPTQRIHLEHALGLWKTVSFKHVLSRYRSSQQKFQEMQEQLHTLAEEVGNLFEERESLRTEITCLHDRLNKARQEAWDYKKKMIAISLRQDRDISIQPENGEGS